MKSAITYLVFLDLIFLMLLSLSGFFAEPLSSVIYYVAFLLPIIIFAILIKAKKCDFHPIRVTISKENLLLTVPVIMPTVGAIIFLSFITSRILGLFFEAPPAEVSGNLFADVVEHALVPALLEEALFRYVPIALLASCSRRECVFVSALLFSLVHCNLFQIPYAFFAGILLAAMDIAFGSILPSLVVHFLNNSLSVVYMKYGTSDKFANAFVLVTVILCAVSGAFVLLFRNKYKDKFVFKDGKIKLSAELAVFIVLTLVISVSQLLR